MCDTGVGPHRRRQDEPMSPTHRARRPAGVPRPLRVIVPALLILIWLTAGAIGGPYFGRVDEVTSNDQTTFLPESAEATLVQEQLGDFTGDEAIPAIVVITGNTPVGEEDLAVIEDETTTLTDIDGVLEDISPAISSEDQLAVQIFVPIDADADLTAVRSEEHTSELQSRGHLVCRLLLEKKKISHIVICI